MDMGVVSTEEPVAVWKLTLALLLAISQLAPEVCGGSGGHFARSGFSGFYRASEIGGKNHPVPNLSMGPQALASVGGVIFQQDTITLSPWVRSSDLRLELADDGAVVLECRGTALRCVIPPWILRPLVEIVESGQPSLVSLIGGPRTKEEIAWTLGVVDIGGYSVPTRSGQGVFFVEMHPKLYGTLLGMELLFLDMSLIHNGAHIAEVDRLYNVVLKESNHPTYSSLGDIDFLGPNWDSDSLRAAIRNSGVLKPGEWEGYVFTDSDTKFTLDLSAEPAVAGGWPYYHFFVEYNNQFVLLDDVNDWSADNGWVYTLRPLWEEARRAAWWMAVFRTIKEDRDTSWFQKGLRWRDNWTHFLWSVRRRHPEAAPLETPRAWVVSVE